MNLRPMTGGTGGSTGTGGFGPLDDLAVAFEGLHPASVWLTRLEANLPRATLSADLQIQAAPQQRAVSNAINVTSSTGDPCDVGAAGLMAGGPGSRAIRVRNRLALLVTVLGAVLTTVARRKRRVFVLAGGPVRSS